MQQQLYQRITATADSNGQITFTFPPVPQGLVWTGAITLYQQLSPFSSAAPFYGAKWGLARNGQGILSYTGEAVVSDVQAVAQEVVTLTGVGLKPGTVITATWTGYSEDAGMAPYLSPTLYGRENAYSQVYTSPAGGPGSPLDVTSAQIPTPAQVQVATGRLTGGPNTLVIVNASPQQGWSLWSATITLTTAWTGTGSPTPYQAHLQWADGTEILSLDNIMMPSTSQSATTSLEFHGARGGLGNGIQMVLGSFAGTSVRFNATVVITPQL